MAEYDIKNFAGGINESVDTSLIASNEAEYARNCDMKNGSLKPQKGLLKMEGIAECPVNITTLMMYYNGIEKHYVAAGEGKLYLFNGTEWILLGTGYGSDKWDFINYKLNNEDVMILVNGINNNKILKGVELRNMKDRRVSYDDLGAINGYYDANGVLRATEDLVTTLAPVAKFVELHFERVWLGGDKSIYFSKDFDPEDFTIPVTELEANQHGGEIVMESFDATKIVGLKVIFNDIVIFKEKSIFKIVGAYAEQYEKIQLFGSNGAIADGSIISTPRGAYFLHTDGIYVYDGVNCAVISDKLTKTIAELDKVEIVNARASEHRGHYLIGVKHITNWITIDFDYENNTFMVYTIPIKGFLNVVHDLYATLGDKYIYEYAKGLYLPLEWHTGIVTADVPQAIKECEDIYFTGKGQNITVTLRTEKKDKTKVITLNDNLKVTKKTLINYGRLIQFLFSTVATEYTEIIGFKAIMDTDFD